MIDNIEDYKGLTGNHQMNCLLNDMQSKVRTLSRRVEHHDDDIESLVERVKTIDELLELAIKGTSYDAISSKKRTKIEYIKFDFKFAWEAVKLIEDGGTFWVKKTEGLNPFWVEIDYTRGAVSDWEFAHKEIETEIDWTDVLVETIKTKGEEISFGSVRVGDKDLSDKDFLIMIHEIASMTDKPE